MRVRINDPAKLDAAQTELQKLAPPLSAQSGQRSLSVSRRPDQTLVHDPRRRVAPGPTPRKAVDQTIEVIRRRIDSLGTREPTIIKQGLNRIVVEAPGESDPETAEGRDRQDRQAQLPDGGRHRHRR